MYNDFFSPNTHHFLEFSHDICTYGLECWPFRKKLWCCNIPVKKAFLVPLAQSRDAPHTFPDYVPWDPGMPQINYRCSEILIFLAFEELWLWPSAKSSLIHLLQYAVQTWLFSTCATIEESLRLCMAFKALQSRPHPSLPA